MAEYNFNQRKNDVLNKLDKSYAGKWDEKISDLCKKINSKKNYYTTSSCSGRALVMIDQLKKGAGLFVWTAHKNFSFGELKNSVEKFEGGELLKFKCEPPIIHIVCKTLKDAEKILEMGFLSGWKNSGIKSVKNNIVVELHGTEKLEFPIFSDGKFLVEDKFLDLIVEKSNKKLEKGWKMIETLTKSI